jgi:SNF2 family DNA or RNA helicase
MQSTRPGERIFLRHRPWRVTKAEALDGVQLLGLEALDGLSPRDLEVASPPDSYEVLPSENLVFDKRALDTFFSFASAHQLILASATGLRSAIQGALSGRVSLESYQLAPILHLLAKPRPRLLLADDVGLGKTIEAGLAMLELLARGRAKRILVVTPSGLMLQWQQELELRFGLHFDLVENATGLSRVQERLAAGVSPWDLPRIITSIDYLKKETIRARALRHPWDLVVADEAHSLSRSGSPANPYDTQRTKLGKELARQSKGLLLLTATPHNGYLC